MQKGNLRDFLTLTEPSERIPSNFDWRPYIELKGYSPEQQERVEKALDNLAAYSPGFQYTVEAACSPEMMALHSDLVEEVRSSPTMRNIANAREDYSKLVIQNKFSDPKFNQLTRTIYFNCDIADRIRMRDASGNKFTPSYEHILGHEIEHAGDPEVYTLTTAKLKADKILDERSHTNPLSSAAAKMLSDRQRSKELDVGSVEVDVLHATASAMQKGFTENCRPTHKGSFSLFAKKEEVEINNDVAFPLPITNGNRKMPPTVEQQVDNFLANLDLPIIKTLSNIEDVAGAKIAACLPNNKTRDTAKRNLPSH